MIYDKTFPFHSDINWRIKNKDGEYWRLDKNNYVCCVNELRIYGNTASAGWILPCSYHLIQNSDYEKNVSENNPLYTEKERLQFTLDLFRENELWPIFDDAEITD